MKHEPLKTNGLLAEKMRTCKEQFAREHNDQHEIEDDAGGSCGGVGGFTWAFLTFVTRFNILSVAVEIS